MAGELEYSKTAGSNAAINGIAILGSSSIKYGNDAIQQLMADQASAITRVADKAAGTYTALKTDHNQLWRATDAVTINLTEAATLTDGWALWVKAEGGTVTIDPNGAETIDGAATLTLPNGASACIRCTGITFVSVIFSNTVDALNRYSDFRLSNNVADATNDIDITDQKGILATITKRLDAAWAVGSGNGGLDTGSIANTTYHVWLIRRPDTGVVDVLFSASATSPTMPANYTQKAYLWPILREGGAIVPFVQTDNTFKRSTPLLVRNSAAAFAEALLAVGVPTGIQVFPILSHSLNIQTINTQISVSIRDASLSGPQQLLMTGLTSSSDAFAFIVASPPPVHLTNTSGQLRFAQTNTAGAPATSQLYCLGWVVPLGRNS